MATERDWQAMEYEGSDAEANRLKSCIRDLRARVEALEAELKVIGSAFDEVATELQMASPAATCPYIRSTDEGTSHCALAAENSNPTPNNRQIRAYWVGNWSWCVALPANR